MCNSLCLHLQLERNEFKISLRKEGKKNFRFLNMENDRKLVNAHFWKHLPAIMACKTHAGALQVVTNLEQDQHYHEEKFNERFDDQPLILAYEVARAKGDQKKQPLYQLECKVDVLKILILDKMKPEKTEPEKTEQDRLNENLAATYAGKSLQTVALCTVL